MIRRFWRAPLRLCVCMIALTVFLPFKAAAQSGFEEAVKMEMSTFKAGLSTGFNYDLLRSPTAVSFDYPVGFFGFNIPLGSNFDIRSLGGADVDDFFNDEDLFRNGKDFKPEAGAGQNANYTVRVDMPMLGGVGSFAYTQNFFMNYHTTLGDATLYINPNFSDNEDLKADKIDLNFFMKGGVSIPLQLSLGWETLTFGYAYRLNRDVVFALNLHRHLFSMNLRGRADVDLLGNLDASIDADVLGNIAINHLLDFPAEMTNGSINGKFTAAAWTPSIGVKYSRLSLTSRFGLNAKAKGSINGQFRMPDIIDVETGNFTVDLDENISPDDAVELINRLSDVSVDSIGYESTESMRWKLPQGHTITLDVVRDVFSLSYTKIFGDVEMKLKNIRRTSKRENSEESGWDDTLNVDLGVTVDHIITANLTLFGAAFLNLGVFALDVRSEDKENILGDAVPSQLRLGKAAMLPMLSLGGTVGSKIKLHLELDLLPLPAGRTGIFYYF